MPRINPICLEVCSLDKIIDLKCSNGRCSKDKKVQQPLPGFSCFSVTFGFYSTITPDIDVLFSLSVVSGNNNAYIKTLIGFGGVSSSFAGAGSNCVFK